VKIVYGNLKSENSQCPETSTKLYIHEFGFWTSEGKFLATDWGIKLYIHDFGFWTSEAKFLVPDWGIYSRLYAPVSEFGL
jgi:hypothetical protein